jgi:PPM family protein phosphatase
MIVEVFATSHVGRIRQGNEDNYLLLDISHSNTWTSSQDASEFVIESQRFEIDENGVILAVSDGMGGALAGEVASQIAVETVSQRLLKDTDPDATISPETENASLVEKLYDATLYANHLIHRQGRTDPQFQGMGATFTSVGITPNIVDFVQVGDSRAYLIRNSNIKQVTKDQSLVQQLIDAGQITPEEAETHHMKNVILQALGAMSDIVPVPLRFVPNRNDVLLVCTDGLSNEVRNAEMLAIVMQNFDNLGQACAMLIKEANDNGGKDNITVVLARLSGDDLEEPTSEDVDVHQLSFANIHDTNEQENTAELL